MGAHRHNHLTRLRRIIAVGTIGLSVATGIAVPGLIAVAAPAGAATSTFEMSGEDGTLPPAVVGNPYGVQLVASGGASSYEVLSGSLPVGLSMSSGGLISGVPALPQTATVLVGAYKVYTPVADEWLTMTVSSGDSALDPTLTPIGNALAADEGSVTGSVLGQVDSELAAVQSLVTCVSTAGCIK